MDYERDGRGGILARIRTSVDNNPSAEGLRFIAHNVRPERTGVHARVTIAYGTTVLAYSAFNVERDEERVRLTNSAWSSLGEVTRRAYVKQDLKHDLDIFCLGLWDASLTLGSPQLMEGDAQPSRAQFLLEPYIIEGAGTILFGPPERGKSLTAMLMAVSMDEGLSDIWPVIQGTALYVNTERSAASMSRRLGQVNEALGLTRRRPLLFLNARGVPFPALIDRVGDAVQRQGVMCVFWDSISRAGVGPLIEDRTANTITDGLNGLGCAWVAIGHSPRADDTRVYGSIHFDAGADVTVQQLAEKGTGHRMGIGLQLTKRNDIPDYPMQVLTYEFHPDWGLERVRKARAHEWPGIEGDERVPLGEAIVRCVALSGEMTAALIAEETGRPRTKVSQYLAAAGRTGTLRAVQRGREVWYTLPSPHPDPGG